MKNNNFEETLQKYKKVHPGHYCNYPCPKCGSPISITYGPGVSYEECVNPDCDYSFDDVFDVFDF